MTKTTISVKTTLTAIFIAIFISLSAFSQSQNFSSTTKFKVKFSENSSKSLSSIQSNPQKTKSGIVLTGISSIDALNEQYQVMNLKRVFPNAGKFEEKHEQFGLHLWYEFEIAESKSVEISSCIETFQKDKNVQICEPYYKKQIIGEGTYSIISDTVNDPRWKEQWHYNNDGQTGGTVGADISLYEAWKIEAGSDHVIVAVIDGGVDYNHTDLSGAMWNNTAEINGTAGVDDDNNGYIDDIHGYGFGDGIGNYNPGDHGTHVGGTIGATNNNGIGVCGIAGGNNGTAGVRLMSCAVFGSYGQNGFDVAFVYAADNGAIISQNSWGYTSSGFYEQSVLDAIDYFVANAGYDANNNPIGPMQGGLVIFAAGNDGNDGAYYPGYYEPVLSVSSTNHNDQKSGYSNYGSWVDIAAPGGETNITNQGVLSTLPNNSYGFYQGTSMACPHVSGVAALVVSKYGENGLTANMLWDRLTETVDNIDAINSNYVGLLGSGRLNAYKALMEDDGIPPNAITDVSLINTGMTTVELEWTATGFSADSGAASGYDIRYANFEITDANFNSANKVTNVPVPSMVGSTEIFEISELCAETTFWFAIKAYDYFGNTSAISNIILATTDNAPIIAYNPSLYIHSIDSGFEEIITAQIQNIGSVDLTFTISPFTQVSNTLINTASIIDFGFIPKRGEEDTRVGHPVLEGGGNDGETGFGYKWLDNKDGNGPAFNWVDITSTGTSLSFGLDDSQEVDLPFNFPFYGENKNRLHISSNGFLTFNSNNSTEYINQQIPNTAGPNDLIAFMWDDFDARMGGTVHYYGDSEKFIVQYTNLKHYSSSDNYTVQAILYPNGNILFQYLEINGSTTSNTIGIENTDGTEGLQVAFNTDYVQENLAILFRTSLGFITDATPMSGTIIPSANQAIDITINSNELSPDNYFDSISVNSNDPLKPTSYFPIKLHVNGIPNVFVNQDNLSFDTIFVDVLDSLPINITNTGTDSLFITNLTILDDLFYLDGNLNEIKLYNNEVKKFYIYFNPNNDIEYFDTLELTTNTSNSLIRIPLYGNAVYPPVASINPHLFNYNLISGDSLTDNITLSNTTGQSSLYSSLSNIIYIENESSSIAYNLQEKIITTSIIDNENTEEISIVSEGMNNAKLCDLTNVKIGVLSLGSYSIIQTDVSQRGGSLQLLSLPLSANALSDIDAVILDDNMSLLSIIDIDLLRQNMNSGLSILSIADNSTSLSNFTSIFANTGINPISQSFIPLSLTNFTTHETTQNISEIDSPSSGFYFTNNNPAQSIITDNSNQCRFSISKYGKGKAAAFCNEIVFDNYIGSTTDNRLFCNQLIDWLCDNSNDWLTISNETDTITAGNSKLLPFEIKTKEMLAGKYKAKLCFETNAPNLHNDTVLIDMLLTGHPVLEVSTDTITYDSIFVGVNYFKQITLRNIGTDTLKISNIASTSLSIITDTTSLQILPQSLYNLLITYNPSVSGIINEELTITSNDTNGATFTIPILGNSFMPPICNLSTDSIEFNLYTGATTESKITLKNAGGSDLTYLVNYEYLNKIDTTFPKVNSEGDFHYLTNTPTYITCIVSDPSSGKLYGQIRYANTFVRYNVETSIWDTLASCPIYSGSYASGTYLDGKIYTGYSSNSTIGIYDIANNSWSQLNTNYSFTSNIETDGELIYIVSYTTFASYNPNNKQWSNLSNPNLNFYSDGGLSYYEGSFYAHNGSNSFYKYQIDSNYWSPLASPPSSLNYGSAIDTYTGKYYSYYNSYLYIYDITSRNWTSKQIPGFSGRESSITYLPTYNHFGIYFSEGSYGNSFVRYETKPTYNWLSIDHYIDTLEALISKDINLTVDTKNLTKGQYHASILFNSNDPIDTTQTVSIILNVRNAANLSLSKDSIHIKNTFLGYQATDTLTIFNNGTDTLRISSISVGNNSVFSVSENIIKILPKENKAITITAAVKDTALTISELIISSNAKPNSLTKVKVSAKGKIAPTLNLINNDLVSYTMPGQKSSEKFSFVNTGGSELGYAISGGEQTNYDSTSTKYFSTHGEDTYHTFNSNYIGDDSIKLEIILNGYYSYSWAYAELEIEGINYGIINDGNVPIGTDCKSIYYLNSDSVANWMNDGKLEIYIRNNSSVSAGYGQSKNLVKLSMNGTEWFILPDTTGVLMKHDTLTLEAEFDAKDFGVGDYYTSFNIATNDPSAKNTIVPVTLKVRNQEAPFVQSPLPDILHYITKGEVNLDFSNVFFDVNYDKLTYTVNSSNIYSVYASTDSTNMNLKLLSTGSSVISLNATDRNFTPTTTQFSILVLDNTSTEILANISDTTVYISAAPVLFDLTKYFFDSDLDVLTYNVLSDNELIASTKIDTTTLSVNPLLVGNNNITITATDNKGTYTNQNFNVSVIENLPPEVIDPIANMQLYITESLDYIILSSVFIDRDGDSIYYSVSTTDSNVVIPTLFTDTLSFEKIAAGNCNITICAWDKITDTIRTYSNIELIDNAKPEVTNSIADILANIESQASSFNLASIFTDANGDSLSYRVLISDTATVAWNMADTIFTIQPKTVGETKIAIYATDRKSGEIFTEFNYTIEAINQSPNLNNPIANQQIYTTQKLDLISIAHVFTDPEGDSIQYSVSSNDSSSVIATLTGKFIRLETLIADTAYITLTAWDGISTASTHLFSVVVIENSPPVVLKLSDIEVKLDTIEAVINLNSYFNDADSDKLTFNILPNTDSISIWELTDSLLTILPSNLGKTYFIISASDSKSEAVVTSFSYNVTANNNAPSVIKTPANKELYLIDVLESINLENIFYDIDGDLLSYAINSSNSNVAEGSINSNIANIELQGEGVSIITLFAWDKYDTVSVFFNITVKVNKSPELVKYIDNFVVSIDSSSILLNLNNYFYDADGDSIKYRVVIDENEIVDWYFVDSTIAFYPRNTGVTSFIVFATDNKSKEIQDWFNFTVISQTGINQLSSKKSMVIYPNPFTNNVKIQFQLDKESEVQIDIFSAKGNLIKSENLGLMKEKNFQHIINLSEMQNAVYYIQLIVNNEIKFNQKIIKQ
ncbi:MAG: S8 family serine peptidase [Salinivirgaceae bacterium]|nr:S8 family serine peptidase [Salinivirgaceae bacterium]